VTFPAIAGAASCDLLRVDQNGAAAPGTGYTAPYYGNAFSVASGLACGSGASVSVADTTPTGSLPTYKGKLAATAQGYHPVLTLWPGAIVLAYKAQLTGHCGQENALIVETYGNAPTVNCNEFNNAQLNFNASTLYQGQTSAGISQIGNNLPSGPSAALMLEGQAQYGRGYYSGAINFAAANTRGPTDLITCADTHFFETMATAGNRRIGAAGVDGDCAMGLDGPSNYQMAFRSGVTIDNYINHVFDGISWLERLSATAKTFTVPVTAPSFTGSLLGNASTATNLAAAAVLPAGTGAHTDVQGTSNSDLATTEFVEQNQLPVVAGKPGDLLCAMAGDTTIQQQAFAGGSATGTVVTLNSVIGAANYAYKIPGQLFGITGSSVRGLNGGPYSVTGGSTTTVVFHNSLVAAGRIATGGTMYRWCENQTTDAVRFTGFALNHYTVAANAIVPNQTFNVRAQLGFVTSSPAAGMVMGLMDGSTYLTSPLNYMVMSGEISYRSGEISFDIVDLTAGTSGFLTTTVQALTIPTSSLWSTIYNKVNQPVFVNTTLANNLQLFLGYGPTGLASIHSSRGCSVAGAIGQTVLLTSFNLGSTATATLTLAAANTLAGATATITNRGQGATGAPTRATCSAGTASSASGSASLTTTLGGSPGNAVDLTSFVVRQ
jgi:hypothetical protein